MLAFVICEDEKLLAKHYKNEIDKFMMRYDIDYKVLIFAGYTEEWRKYAETEEDFKIYLLDIKTARGSGLDAARIIREEIDDWVSLIIVITAYTEYKYDALGKRLMLVDFINKLDNCDKHLKETLNICMKHYDKKPHALRYTYKNGAYNIEFKKITYIEKEIDTKRCIIHTIDSEYYAQDTINNMLRKLDKRFTKSSRSVIVNIEQIEEFDGKENIIKFKNGETVDIVSRSKRKELMKRVRDAC